MIIIVNVLQKVDYRYDAAGKLLEINTPAESECMQGEEICLLEAKIRYVPKYDRCGGKLATVYLNGQAYQVTETFVFGVTDLGTLRQILMGAMDFYGLTGTVQVYSAPFEEQGVSGAEYVIEIENTTIDEMVLVMAPHMATGYECKHAFVKNEKNCCEVEMPIGPGSAGVDNPLTTSNYDLFTEKIKYDHWDIARINYGSDCVSGGMRNEFKYDKNHRVTSMDNFMFKNGLMTPGVYSEQFTYDNVIGDLGTLMRSSTSLLGVTNPTVPYQANNIDDLKYAYSNGRLVAVREFGNSQRGFKTSNTTYTHDNNGNMLTDSGKGLNFKYNVINLPQRINNTATGQSMTNIYAFSGEKVLSKGPQGVRKYLGGMEYLNEKPQHYAHAEGRIQYAGTSDPELGEIQFKIADHLGNLMVLFGDKDDDRKINTETAIAADNSLPEEIVQRHFYYAYGMEMEGPWQHTPLVGDAYRYNGKELVGDLGMGLMDYGFRYYDPILCRFISVDPLAEYFYALTTCQFASNMPIKAIDLDGLEAYIVNEGWENARRTISVSTMTVDGHISQDQVTNHKVMIYRTDQAGRKLDPIYADKLNPAQQAVYDKGNLTIQNSGVQGYGKDSFGNEFKKYPNAIHEVRKGQLSGMGFIVTNETNIDLADALNSAINGFSSRLGSGQTVVEANVQVSKNEVLGGRELFLQQGLKATYSLNKIPQISVDLEMLQIAVESAGRTILKDSKGEPNAIRFSLKVMTPTN